MSTEFEDLTDLMELISFTLGNDFIQAWRHKYSEHFIKMFQGAILDAFKRQKPIKINSLINQLQKNNKYSKEQIVNFLQSIDVSLYRPIIQGNLNV